MNEENDFKSRKKQKSVHNIKNKALQYLMQYESNSKCNLKSESQQKAEPFLPFLNERDSLGRLLSTKELKRHTIRKHDSSYIKIASLSKADHRYKMIRKNHFIFPELSKGEGVDHLHLTNIYESFDSSISYQHTSKNSTEENSLCKILLTNGKNIFEEFKKNKREKFDNNENILITDPGEISPKKIKFSKLLYNEARSDNFQAKFSRFLPFLIKKKKKIKNNIKIDEHPGAGFYDPIYTQIHKRVPMHKISEIEKTNIKIEKKEDKKIEIKREKIHKKNYNLEFEREFAKLLKSIDAQAQLEEKKNKNQKQSLDWVLLDDEYLEEYHNKMKKYMKNMRNILQRFKDSAKLIY